MIRKESALDRKGICFFVQRQKKNFVIFRTTLILQQRYTPENEMIWWRQEEFKYPPVSTIICRSRWMVGNLELAPTENSRFEICFFIFIILLIIFIIWSVFSISTFMANIGVILWAFVCNSLGHQCLTTSWSTIEEYSLWWLHSELMEFF